jgi:hypothetical protein
MHVSCLQKPLRQVRRTVLFGSGVQVTIGDYIQWTSVSNFRNSWEALDPGLEKVDEYGLGPRDSLQEAVKAVINTLGMQPVEVRPRSTPTASQIPWPGGR